MAFDMTFDLQSQIQGQSTDVVPKLCQYVNLKDLNWRLASLGSLHNHAIVWEWLWSEHYHASYHLRPFWYTCRRYSLPRLLLLNLTLMVKCQVKRHACVSCSGRLAIVWDYFGTSADVISGRFPVPRTLTFKFECQVKCHSCASFSGRLPITWDPF